MEKVNQNLLNNPEDGRAYLKAALDQNDEKVFLQALHNIMDSFVCNKLDLRDKVFQLAELENING